MLAIGTQKKWGFISIIIIIALVVGFQAYQKRQVRQAQLRFARAEALYNYKKYQEAAREYEFIATRYPRREYVPACWYKAGYIYRHFLFNDAAAARALQKLLDLFPGNQYRKEALILLVDIQARLGQYKEQNDTIRRLLAEFPGAVDEEALRLELATGFYKLGQNKEALEQLALIKNKKSNVIRNSQEYYRLLSFQDPLDPQPHVELSRIYKGMGLQERAAVEFGTAEWIKKNAAEVKAAAQKTSATAKYVRGPTQEKAPPKLQLTAREEELYIAYKKALEIDWPKEMYGFGMSLGQPEDEKETGIAGQILQEHKDFWWQNWYKSQKTTLEECDRMLRIVANDEGLEQKLNLKLSKLKNKE